MKKVMMFLVVCSLLSWAACKDSGVKSRDAAFSGTVTISGAWALYPMAVKWAEEFQKIHPQVKIDISAGGAGKGMADALAGIADLGMVSRSIYPEEVEKGAWFVAVTKDAVVPTINENNPALKDLLTKGVKRESLVDIWLGGKTKTWGELAGSGEKSAINVYTRSDSCGAAEVWASYLGKKQENLLGVGVYGDPGIAQAVTRDAAGLGYNNINFAYDAKTRKQLPGLKVLPLDVNGNGIIDQAEDFYGTLDQIDKAIAEGNYPSPPARDLYLVSQGRPSRELVRVFLQWILTDGQKYIPESGYIRLGDEKIKEQLKKLD